MHDGQPDNGNNKKTIVVWEMETIKKHFLLTWQAMGENKKDIVFLHSGPSQQQG